MSLNVLGMMLCNSCNDDIFEDDALKCSVCNEFYHFMCSAMREFAFRKMSKVSKQKWSCNNCKVETNTISRDPDSIYHTKNPDIFNFLKFNGFSEFHE